MFLSMGLAAASTKKDFLSLPSAHWQDILTVHNETEMTKIASLMPIVLSALDVDV